MTVRNLKPLESNTMAEKKRKRPARAIAKENDKKYNMDLRNKQTARKKALVLEALSKNGVILTSAAKAVGIDRRTIQRWCDTDPTFKEKMLDLQADALQFVEDKLMQKINDGNLQAIMFYLRCKSRPNSITPAEGYDEQYYSRQANKSNNVIGKNTDEELEEESNKYDVAKNIDEVKKDTSQDALMSGMAKMMQIRPDLLDVNNLTDGQK